MDRPGHKVPFRDAQSCHAEHRRLRVQRRASRFLPLAAPGFATLRGAMQPKHQLGLTPVLT